MTSNWWISSLTAKGHGKDALGQVDIVANYNGRRFHGVGLATDAESFRQSHGARTEQYTGVPQKMKKSWRREAQHNENNKETV